ncbi:hypothetical protein BCON_0028g00580 [Botryotinia convoluta]|uniref:Uncharacterized protein n=1 Tax=Botryotinia convoluta TaxID=54673 RepID=A0A4Z1IID0_9HELO|nr:hypothetical protein BCON_0028g00580 [Botryotinia convoluta]
MVFGFVEQRKDERKARRGLQWTNGDSFGPEADGVKKLGVKLTKLGRYLCVWHISKRKVGSGRGKWIGGRL